MGTHVIGMGTLSLTLGPISWTCAPMLALTLCLIILCLLRVGGDPKNQTMPILNSKQHAQEASPNACLYRPMLGPMHAARCANSESEMGRLWARIEPSLEPKWVGLGQALDRNWAVI